MIDIDYRNFSTSPFGTIAEDIDGTSDDIEVKLSFEQQVGSIPVIEKPVIFYVGGKVYNDKGEEIDDTFEIMMAVEKVDDTTLRVDRTLLPIKSKVAHKAGEEAGFMVTGGQVYDMHFRMKMLMMESEIRYLGELIHSIAGGQETLLVPNMWTEYDNFKVIPSTPASNKVNIQPGGMFVKDGEFSKTFVIPPGEDIDGKSTVTFEFPQKDLLQYVLLYISTDGSLRTVAEDPGESDPAKPNLGSLEDLFKPLAYVLLDSTKSVLEVTSINIQDLRDFGSQQGVES